MKTGIQIAQKAKEMLTTLTCVNADTISGYYKDDLGWHVIVEMTELKRIPASTDVMATYETLLDDEGNMVSYRRTKRYLREQIMESED